MNILKIIKVYFAFIMVLVFMAVLSYNDTIEYYIVSVFHSSSSWADNGLTASFYGLDSRGRDEDRRVFVSRNENSNIVNFTITNDPENGFAEPGSKNVEIMQFVFKTADKDLFLRDLNLKIVGVDPDDVEKAVLVKDGEVIKKGKRSDDYFLFRNVNYKIDGNSEQALSLYVDLSPNLRTGQRFSMNIEEPDDILLMVGGQPYSIDQYYPIKGKYLSIARPRLWSVIK